MNSNNKHIVLLTPGFPESEEDSTTIPALQIFAKALLVNNPQYSLKIITFQFPFTTKKYNWFGAEIIPLNGRNNRVKKFSVWKKATTLLQKFNVEKKIDIIHSFWIGECAYIGQKFAKKYKIKHLITAMGQDVKANLWLNVFTKSLFKNSYFITLSKKQKSLLLKNYNIESSIISWGINADNFPKNQEKTIDILGVGSLNKVKNYYLFLKIIAKLNLNNLKVEIIGEGDLEMHLKKEKTLHNLETIIKFNGKLPRNEVLIKMTKAKVLLHTSIYESFGMVFLEALNSQMKIVSFDVGFAENSENWKVCKTKQQMIESVRDLLKNYSKPTAENYHLINNTVLKYCEIYNE